MGFFSKIFKRKKSSSAIKKAVAVSSISKKPISISNVPITSSNRRNIVTPFFADTKVKYLPVQLDNVNIKPTLTRASYVSKSGNVKQMGTIKPLKPVVNTPILDTIKPFVSQIKTTLEPVDKVVLKNVPVVDSIVKETNLIKDNSMMQKIKDFVKLYTWKLLIPVALLVGLVFYMKTKKRTIKRK